MFNYRKLIIWLVLLLAAITGCAREQTEMKIDSVIHTSDSGALLPDLQWHEEILITRNKAVLQRNGKTTDSRVNAGIWEIMLDEKSVSRFYEQLLAVDCSEIKRIEPEEPPDGGGSVSYSVIYSNKSSCTLYFDPGTTYIKGEAVVDLVDQFIRGIVIPADAIPRTLP